VGRHFVHPAPAEVEGAQTTGIAAGVPAAHCIAQRYQAPYDAEHGVATAKYSRSAKKDVKSAMRRHKKGTLKSGKGGKGGTVKSRKQAIAIGLSEARKKGKQEGAEASDLREEIQQVVMRRPVVPLRRSRWRAAPMFRLSLDG
jgi:hypothetical protein